MDLESLAEVMRQACGLVPGRPVVAGVSGGPDSLCLMEALDRCGCPVIVAHFDHHLRPESSEDARLVAGIARGRGLRFVLGEADVADLARQAGQSIEEAAREARYRFLFDQARAAAAQAVAVGHTADDQVETVLMHLLRGAGLSGLRGMTYRSCMPLWDPEIPLVRPLLGFWREDTLACCEESGLQPVFDRTNQDTTYFRNRLRHELIPLLETYNPRFKQALWRTSRTLAAEDAFLREAVQDAEDRCLRQEGAGYQGYDLICFRQLPLAVRRGLIRQAIGQLRPTLRDVDFETVDRCLDFIDRPPRTGQVHLVQGLRLVFEMELFMMADENARLPAGEWPQVREGCPSQFEIPGVYELEEDWKLIGELVPIQGDEPWAASPAGDGSEAWLDASSLFLPLLIRGIEPGDRFQPLGMEAGSLKLSDFFINEKLPRRARERWPLVCTQGVVAWVPGYRPAQAFRVKPGDRLAVHLRMVRGTGA